MKVSIASAAELELTAGARFYAEQADAALGYAFIDEFERAIDLLRSHPGLGAPWRGTTRRLPLRRFPYSVVYELLSRCVACDRVGAPAPAARVLDRPRLTQWAGRPPNAAVQ